MKLRIFYDNFFGNFFDIFCNYENLVMSYKDFRQIIDDLDCNVFFEHFEQEDFVQ